VNNKNEVAEEFSGDLYQAIMVRKLLESNGIKSFIENGVI
jgi:hypothetical protein